MKNLLVLGFGLGLLATTGSAVIFSGNVDNDFTYAQQTLTDLSGDVGLSPNAPAGTVSGWDIDYASFLHFQSSGTLEIGIRFFGVAGDADGDGGEGTTSPWLAGNGGEDLASLDETESICIALDFDQDGNFDLIAGVSSNDTTYDVTAYCPSELGISFSFCEAATGLNGGYMIGQDAEFRITDYPPLMSTEEICIDVHIFAGSLQDDGIGEDALLGTICFQSDVVEAELPTGMNLLSAYPNPFNPTTTLQVELAQTGMVELAVYNLNGQLVNTVHSGMLEAGGHALNFNASALPSGLYLARLATDQGVQVERLLLTK